MSDQEDKRVEATRELMIEIQVALGDKILNDPQWTMRAVAGAILAHGFLVRDGMEDTSAFDTLDFHLTDPKLTTNNINEES